MIQSIKQKLRNFRRSEDGTVAVAFAFMFPFFVGILLAGVEIGVSSMRHTALERSVDETVRWIRLNTGAAPTHAQLKEVICSRNIVSECQDNLQLEMVVRDMRSWEDLPETLSCVDNGVVVNEMSELSFGQDNEMVILRVCARYKPLFKALFFATPLSIDSNGDAYLKYTSAFVQEPR